MAIKICAKCGKKFSTKNANMVLCRECMDKDVVREAERLNAVYATKKCPACGEEFVITVGEKEFYDAHSMELPRFCKPCRDTLKGHREEMQTEHTCAKCGGKFHMSALNILMNITEGRELPTECPSCRQAAREEARQQNERKKPYKTVTCKDCGKQFVITQGEHDFLTEHGYENDPVRCYACRKKRKSAALAQDMRAEKSEVVENADADADAGAGGAATTEAAAENTDVNTTAEMTPKEAPAADASSPAEEDLVAAKAAARE